MTMNTITTVGRFPTVIATALFGTASGFAVLPAVADSVDPPQITVKYADLNVDSAKGAAVLYARIRHAAKNVCLQSEGGGLDVYGQREACMNKAIFGAVTKVNAPALYAVYRVKTGKEAPTRLVSR
jgi:UrcA family protein